MNSVFTRFPSWINSVSLFLLYLFFFLPNISSPLASTLKLKNPRLEHNRCCTNEGPWQMSSQCGAHNTCHHDTGLNLCHCNRVIPIKCFPYKSNYILRTGPEVEYGDAASQKEQHLNQRSSSTWALQQVRGHHALHSIIYFNHNKQIDRSLQYFTSSYIYKVTLQTRTLLEILELFMCTST